MNQGLGIVLPMVFFFLIDFTLVVNSLRQRTYTNTTKLFTKLAGCVMIAQGLTAITYACDYKIISLTVSTQYIVNLISLSCMTIASYLWFQYLMVTENHTENALLKKWKKFFLIPVILLIIIGIPSQWTHWLFFIDANGAYQPGTLYFLQFTGYIYYFAAMIFTIWQVGNKKSTIRVLGKFFIYLFPTLIGTIINTQIIRGGYTQIGCSYAVFLLYLEQYITEINRNKRLKNIENLNKNLQVADDSFVEQMNIVGGLSNAYFSVYSVDLESGRCKAIKVIDFFRNIVKNCHITSVVTTAFIAMCVMPEDREKMRKFTEQDTLATRLEDNNLIVQEFHGMISPWEWCRASWIVAARNEKGKPKTVLFTVEDVTESVRRRLQYEEERVQAQKALEASQAAAEAANKAKTDFLFNMSHDIRTPMNAIIGYADLMEKHFGETKKCRDYLDKIKKSSGFLLSLVNNVLEMARIESGKIVLDEEVCKNSDLMEQVISVYSELMEQKGITFFTDIVVENEYYYGDMVKLSEIFLNIVSNAYKYTEKGGKISLSVKELPYNKEGYLLLQTVVADTGIGMSKEYLPKIFEEFSREHTSTENKIEGTGLGMPIVKRLVDFMGGTIEVESELGKGSKFTVTIPHKIAKAKDIRKDAVLVVDPKKFIGKRILLVEDNELNTEIATEVLGEFGFFVEHASDGLICIDMILNEKPGYYDFILMDIQMPNLDGYGATKKIRSLKDKKKANIPIIAMTANAFEEDIQKCIEAGMDAHLAKPFHVDDVALTISKFCEN